MQEAKFLRIWGSPVFEDTVTDGDIAGTLTTRDNAYVILIGNIGNGVSHQRRNVFDSQGIAPTLMASMGMGGGIIPFIVEKQDGKSS